MGTIIAGIVSTVAAPQCVLLLSGNIDDKYFDSFNPLDQPTISDDYIAFGIVQSPADDNFTHISRVCALRLHILETINQYFQPSASSCINLTRNFDTYILCPSDGNFNCLPPLVLPDIGSYLSSNGAVKIYYFGFPVLHVDSKAMSYVIVTSDNFGSGVKIAWQDFDNIPQTVEDTWYYFLKCNEHVLVWIIVNSILAIGFIFTIVLCTFIIKRCINKCKNSQLDVPSDEEVS